MTVLSSALPGASGAAVGIGLSAGAAAFFAGNILKGIRGYDDPLDTLGAHAVGGTGGAFLGAGRKRLRHAARMSGSPTPKPQLVVLTGAGMSAESGLRTFRGADGLWENHHVEDVATPEGWARDPQLVLRFYNERRRQMWQAKPNAGHLALAQLERYFDVRIITQNVDNLHEAAGSKNIIEYHGNAAWLICPRCRHRDPLDLTQHQGSPPYCFCGTLMKPDVIMFGEVIPSQALVESARYAETCDVMLVVGTSAQVYPAARLPVLAKQQGAYIIEANTELTEFSNSITDAFLHGRAGETLPRLVETIKRLD